MESKRDFFVAHFICLFQALAAMGVNVSWITFWRTGWVDGSAERPGAILGY